MKLYSENKDYKLYHGNMLDMLEVIEPNSIDSIVTDPPYGLTSITKRFGKENSKENQYGKDGSFQRLTKGFMGKEWDGSGIETNPEAWAKCYEVLKPGGYLLAFGGTRTFHRIACAIEDAGFEIRDTIMWLYGCLSNDTEILTSNGWRNSETINKNDFIYSLDLENNKIIKNKVLNVFKYDYDGEMINLKNQNTDQLLTPNHHCIVKDTTRTRIKGQTTHYTKHDYWCYKDAWQLRSQTIELPLASNYNGEIEIGNLFAELLGWVISEGNYLKDTNAIMITQSDVNYEYVKRIRYILGKLKIRHSEYSRIRKYKDREYTEYDFYIGNEAVEIVNKIKELSPNKKLTYKLLELSLKNKEFLLKGLCKGDGGKSNTEYGFGAFYQKDIEQLEVFQTLLHLTNKQGWINNKKHCCSIHLNPNTQLQGKHNKDRFVKYDGGYVWCIETEIGNFIARRNGKIFITGNSGFPKSLNVGLAIDKKNGVDSKVVGTGKSGGAETHSRTMNSITKTGNEAFGGEFEIKQAQNEWNDWGTALKPAYEPIIVARKPCEGSVVENILKYGTGAMNLGACRIPLEDDYEVKTTKRQPLSNNNAPFNSESCGYKPENDIMASANPNGRFPANVIHDGSEEVIKDMPNTKSEGGSGFKDSMFGFSQQKPDVNFHDSGNASRYFKECKFTEKDDEIWKQLLVNNAVSNLEILEATKESIVQLNVKNLLKELKDHYAKYVESQSKLIETNIAQNIVEILNWDFKIETSQVIQDFITNYNVCIQFLNLAQFVEKMDSIDTTQITQNLLKLFGYVRVVITNYIAGNLKCEQKRFLYEPKASVKDREEGLEDFEKQRVYDGDHNYGYANTENDNLGDRIANVKRANIHPTVKPCSLLQYLIKLVTRDGGTVLDCFNGSGSTGKAVMFENKERNAGYKYIGIELTEEYLPISKARIEYVCNHDFYFSKNDIGRTQHEEIKKSNGVFDIYDFLGEE